MLHLSRQPAAAVADRIFDAYGRFRREFGELTRLSRQIFETRQWHEARRLSLQRLDLYGTVLGDLVEGLRAPEASSGRPAPPAGHRLGVAPEGRADRGEGLAVPELWREVKSAFARHIDGLADFEIAESFYNSTTRRIFHQVGVDPRLDFTVSRKRKLREAEPPITVTHFPGKSTARLVMRILRDYGFAYAHMSQDAELAGAAIDVHLAANGGAPILTVEMMQPVFYRNKGAYLVGRLQAGSRIFPLVFALVHPPEGVVVDAVLMEEDDVSIVFSFTRSHFLVDSPSPSQVVSFLRGILPRKPVHELYTAIGFNRHAKTVQYRDFVHHLKESDDRFEVAAGKKGMVMAVFTLPSYDVVFKVIRDRFPPPKRTTRRQVMEKYRLVFQHDRVGRLVDASEFEHATLERGRFTEEALAELLGECGNTVSLDGDKVVIAHLYTERRITPLDLYLNEAPAEASERAVRDYGQAIKDLAAANIFPGDMFTKNFGVTRHGRVVFYDYDELCFVTDCTFRRLPPPEMEGDELADEPTSYVGPNDAFPEEFRRYIGLRPGLREVFEESHGDLFTVDYWNGLKTRIGEGHLADVFPYPPERRLRPREVFGL